MTLRHTIQTLAEEFSLGILAAIRSASLEDLLAESGSSAGKKAALRAAVAKAAPAATNGKAAVARGAGGRRSAEEIGETIEAIVNALKSNKSGMRSEELQKSLGLSKT